MVKVNKFAEKIARFRHKLKIKEESVNFTRCFADYADCLVLMPSDMTAMVEAASQLPSIAEIFPNRLIKIMLTSNIDPRAHEFIKKFTLIKPYSSDISTFGLPRNEFVERLKAKGLSVCIDLDLSENFFNSTVCALAGAPVRIGRAKGLGLPYYNLEINVGGDDTPLKRAYDVFIGVLRNLKKQGMSIAPI